MDFENADTISIDTLALEEIVQEERAREIKELDRLSKKVCCLHTNMLYYHQVKTHVGAICFDVWKTIIKRVGGGPKCWRDLGMHLGIPQDDLDYIANSMKDDPTDVVLKVFIQSEDATLDKVIDAFVKMNRYDILKAIESPLSNLSQYFYKEDSKSDTGYHSSSKDEEKKKIISLSDIPNDLPPVLRSKNSILISRKQQDDPIQPEKLHSKKTDGKIKNNRPVLLLTFAEDGQETALNIQNKVNTWPEDFPDVTLITLNDRKEDVLQNPERFIREYFEKADYIVPIMTSGYLNAIQQHDLNIPSMSDNLDLKYVHFIYTLIANNYIHLSGCLNRKVRSVLPQNFDPRIMTEITLYPDLMPWTSEEAFDETFQEFLKKEFS